MTIKKILACVLSVFPLGSIAQHIDFEQGGAVPDGWSEACRSQSSPWSISVSPSNRALRAATDELLQPDGADSWLFSPQLPAGGRVSLKVGSESGENSALRIYLMDSPTPDGRILQELTYSANSKERWKPFIKPLSVNLKDEQMEIIGHENDSTRVKYEFCRCMKNKLFTFAKVHVEGTDGRWILVNESYSDNIGPVDIYHCSWIGGDHLYADTYIRTAQCDAVEIYADGVPISEAKNLAAAKVEIKVQNTLFDPRHLADETTPRPMIKETVIYNISGSGNSIHVKVNHRWVNDEPAIINSYYGMQSMFKNESVVVTKAGRYIAGNGFSITKEAEPDLHRFVELCLPNDTYQASWLLPHGLGSHSLIWPGSPIVLHPKSIHKTYHVLIKYLEGAKSPLEYNWEGVYSWGRHALLNTITAHVIQSNINSTDYIFAELPYARATYISTHMQGRAFSLLPQTEDDAEIQSVSEDGIIKLTSNSPSSFVLSAHNPIEPTETISVQVPPGPVYLAFHYQGKGQSFAIDDIDISLESSIDDISAQHPEQIFDLSGRKVHKPTRGILISKNKKTVKC